MMREKKRFFVAAAAIVSLFVLGACGSSTGSAAPSGQSSTTAPVTSSAGGSAPSSGLAGAIAATKTAEAVPTRIGVTTPLTSRPPTGKTVVFLQCEEDQCGLQGQGIAAAAKAIGWQEKTLQFQAANPATLITAMQEALQYKPIAVFFAGVAQQAWQPEVPIYQKAGVAIIPSFVPDTTLSSTVYAALGTNDYSEAQGQTVANFVASDSGGSAKVLLVTVPSYTIFIPWAQTFKQTLSTACPSCTISTTSFTIPQLIGGQVDPAIVSQLRKGSYNYLASVDGAFVAGLPSALRAAGLSGIKIVSGPGTSANQQDVIAGTETATMAEGLVYGGWMDVDVVLRHLEGMSFSPGDGGFSKELLVKANIGTPTNDYYIPTNYVSQFEQLWHVG